MGRGSPGSDGETTVSLHLGPPSSPVDLLSLPRGRHPHLLERILNQVTVWLPTRTPTYPLLLKIS